MLRARVTFREEATTVAGVKAHVESWRDGLPLAEALVDACGAELGPIDLDHADLSCLTDRERHSHGVGAQISNSALKQIDKEDTVALVRLSFGLGGTAMNSYTSHPVAYEETIFRALGQPGVAGHVEAAFRHPIFEGDWPDEVGVAATAFVVATASRFEVSGGTVTYDMWQHNDLYGGAGGTTPEDFGDPAYVDGYGWITVVPPPAFEKLGGAGVFASAPVEHWEQVECPSGPAVVARLAPSPGHVTNDHLVAWRSFLEPVLVPRNLGPGVYRASAAVERPSMILEQDWLPSAFDIYGDPL